MSMRVQAADDRQTSPAQGGRGRGAGGLLAWQILQYLPGTVLPAVVGLLMATVFTRVFRAGEYGLYSIILSVINLLTACTTQWVQQGVSRYLPGERRSIRVAALKGAVGFSLTSLTFLLAILLCLGLLASYLQVAAPWKGVLISGGILLLVSSLFNPLMAVIQAEMRPARFTLYQASSVTLRFVLALGMVFLIHRSTTSLLWASALAVGVLVPLLWQEAEMPNLGYLGRHWRRLLPHVWRLAKFGFPMTGWFLSAIILDVGDRYVLQWFRGSVEVGIYAANYGLVAGAIGLISSPIVLAAHPFLMRAWDKGDPVEAGKWLGTIATWFAVAGTALVGALWIFASDAAMWLLGTEFREGYKVMPVVLAGVILWQLGTYSHKPLEFTGRTKLMFRLSMLSAAVNLVLNILFVPRFGYMSAAGSTVASYALYVGMTAWAGRGVVPWKLKWKELIISELAILGGVVGLNYLRPVVEGKIGYWGSLVLCAALLAATAAVVLWRLLRTLLRRPLG